MKGRSFLPNQPYAIQYEENLIYKVNTIFLSCLKSNFITIHIRVQEGIAVNAEFKGKTQVNFFLKSKVK